jgi:hypothetical protein
VSSAYLVDPLTGRRSDGVELPRVFDIIRRRKWTLIAEYKSGRRSPSEARTAVWFIDNESGVYYVAESWKRPNPRYALNAEQVAYIQRITADALEVRS